MKLEKDTKISHYKILSEIGKGGMGEVYLAEDTKLDRKVAIKFLSEEFVNDSDKLNRFVQEAKAASALNHPNIITIHAIDEADGAQYMALEYIDGETLTDRLKKRLRFDEALDVATQIASALDAAHSAGIVHRDIKPDNVMVRKDGIVKILDFGIAKLTEQVKPEAESEDKTAVQVNTTPGMIIGTANYMSPEQAKGKEVDSRTDIFSFGVLVYEMISGRLPFGGETPMEIIAAVINKEPHPLDDSEVQAEITRILLKALRKDPDDRYQTIKGLLADLKQVRRDFEFKDNPDHTIEPREGQQQTQILQSTTAAEQKQTTNITGETKAGFRKWLVAGGAFGLVAIAILAGWYFMAGDLFSEQKPFAKIKVEELTSAAEIQKPVFSPDGKLIAYSKSAVEGLFEKESLTVRQSGSGAENVIYEVPEGNLIPFAFSPDGESIYFNYQVRGDKKGLYKISTLGGNPKKIVNGDIFFSTISPDGAKIAYEKRNESLEKTFYLADIDGSNSEEILKLSDIEATNMSLGGWHPDGSKLFVAIAMDIESKGLQRLMATLDISNKNLSPKERVEAFYDDINVNFRGATWMPDGKGFLLLIRKQPQGTTNQLWYCSYPEGRIRQITDDFNNYANIALSSDGRSIIGYTQSSKTSVWSVDPETKKGRQIIPENKSIVGGPLSISADGRLFYVKRARNGSVVYSNDSGGADEKELFSTPDRITYLRTSTDAKTLLATVVSDERPSSGLIRFDPDGSDRTQLTDVDFASDESPQLTSAGDVFFSRRWFQGKKPRSIMRIPLEGGEAEKIDLGPSDGDYYPAVSPDGKYLAYVRLKRDESAGSSTRMIRVVELNEGKVGKLVLEIERTVPRIRWAAESDAIIYEQAQKGSNLFKLNLADQTETEITDFNLRADTWGFTVSSDGQRIFVMRSTSSANLVLIRDVIADGN